MWPLPEEGAIAETGGPVKQDVGTVSGCMY